MTATRVFWVLLLGSVLAVGAFVVPFSGVISAHAPFLSDSHGSTGAPSNPWGNNSSSHWGSNRSTYEVSFTETGLPAGTNWTVLVTGGPGWVTPTSQLTASVAPAWHDHQTNTSATATIGFQLANGSYRFGVLPAWNGSQAYVPSPRTGSVAVNGSNVSVAVVFAPFKLYTVSFSESGLPSGTFWSVSLARMPGWLPVGPVLGAVPMILQSVFNGSTNSTVNFSLPDGSYGFSVGNVTNGSSVYVPSPATGNVSVNGSDVTVDISFSHVTTYTVSFTESGLPAGTNWSVQLAGASIGWLENGSANATLNFTVPNGTDNFSVPNATSGTAVYVPTPSNGSVTVQGGAVTVYVTFARLAFYSLTFAESGLPSGTAWFVHLYNATAGCFHNGSTTTAVNFTVPNGTYDFSVSHARAGGTVYAPTPASGTVTISGANATVSVTFAPPPVFNVTFNETGLPNGTPWFVALVGHCTGWGFNQSNGSTIAFTLPNGTYGFVVGPAWTPGTLYFPSPSHGTIVVAGSSVTIDVTFTEVSGPTSWSG